MLTSSCRVVAVVTRNAPCMYVCVPFSTAILCVVSHAQWNTLLLPRYVRRLIGALEEARVARQIVHYSHTSQETLSTSVSLH